MANDLGNSAMLDLLARQRLDRPEGPEWPVSETPAETPPAPVEPLPPLLAQPPPGFGGGA